VDEKFVNDLDFSSIKKLNATFVTEELNQREADIIYEITFRGNPIYIYLLLELQSTVDRFMADRMLEYVRAFSREYCRTQKTGSFPAVFPVVLYNGDQNWDAPTQFGDLVMHSPIPTRYVPQFSYCLIEINRIPKRKLLRIRNALAAIFFVESSGREEIGRSIELLIQFIRKDLPAIYPRFLTWFFEVQDIKLTAKMAKKLRSEMEVTEMLRTKILAERESFFQEGVVFEKQHILIDLMTSKFGVSEKTGKKIKAVKNADKLDRALRIILTADSCEEVLKCLA
jgi:hypothetical protein